MRYFKVSGGRIQPRFKEFETDLLVEFFGQVRTLLIERGADVGQSTVFAEDPADDAALFAQLDAEAQPIPPPSDEVLARLLPSGRRDETARAGESAIEFRRFTEPDLRAGKINDANRAETVLRGRDAMSVDDAETLLRAINDVRLSLGARLDVEESTPYPEQIRTEQDQALAIYFWTGAVQEELVAAVSRVID